MANNKLVTQILLLNGTSGTWANLSTHVLGKGEPAVEFVPGVNSEDNSSQLTSIKLKIGDGFTAFANLPYVADSSSLLALYGNNADVKGLIKEVEELTGSLSTISQEFEALQEVVGDEDRGLVKDVAELKTTVSTLGNAVFEIDGASLDDVDGDTEADKIVTFIATNYSDETVKEGNIAIVKRATGDGFSYTAYAFNGESWAAMDGNYNAENVYFSEDITLAGSYTSVGNVALSDKTLAAKDKSLAQLMQSIFTKELYPATGTSRDLPTLTLSGDSDKTGEVGDSYTLPTVTLTVTDVGNYTYGPATGIVFETGNLTIAQGAVASATNKKSNSSNSGKGATLSLIATDTASLYTDSAKSYTFNASGTYTQGAMPVTNLGNDYPSARIESGTATATARTIKRTGWRNYWYGFISTTDTEGTTISRITDSADANYNKVGDGTKWLTAGGKAIANGTLPTITAAEGDRMPVVLIPTNSGKKVTSAKMPSSLNAPVTFEKSDKTVSLAGLNGATAASYDLWYYKSDDMPVGADFSIVIG